MAYRRGYNPDALPAFAEPDQAANSMTSSSSRPGGGRNPPRTDSYTSKQSTAPDSRIRDDDRRANTPQGYNKSSSSRYDGHDDRRQPSGSSRYEGYDDGRGKAGTGSSTHDYDSRGQRPAPSQHSSGLRGDRPPPPAGGGERLVAGGDNLWKMFDAVDKNRTGQLSERELGTALVNGDYTSFDPHTVKMMIRMFDIDRSGTISYDEFQGLWGFLSEWRKLFDRFDVDKSGSISYDEFSDALVSFGYRLSKEYVTLLFNTYDVKGRGVLSFDLFVQSCISLKRMTDVFKKYDTDRDGYITLSFEEFLTGSQSLFLFNSISPVTDKGLY